MTNYNLRSTTGRKIFVTKMHDPFMIPKRKLRRGHGPPSPAAGVYSAFLLAQLSMLSHYAALGLFVGVVFASDIVPRPSALVSNKGGRSSFSGASSSACSSLHKNPPREEKEVDHNMDEQAQLDVLDTAPASPPQKRRKILRTTDHSAAEQECTAAFRAASGLLQEKLTIAAREDPPQQPTSSSSATDHRPPHQVQPDLLPTDTWENVASFLSAARKIPVKQQVGQSSEEEETQQPALGDVEIEQTKLNLENFFKTLQRKAAAMWEKQLRSPKFWNGATDNSGAGFLRACASDTEKAVAAERTQSVVYNRNISFSHREPLSLPSRFLTRLAGAIVKQTILAHVLRRGFRLGPEYPGSGFASASRSAGELMKQGKKTYFGNDWHRRLFYFRDAATSTQAASDGGSLSPRNLVPGTFSCRAIDNKNTWNNNWQSGDYNPLLQHGWLSPQILSEIGVRKTRKLEEQARNRGSLSSKDEMNSTKGAAAAGVVLQSSSSSTAATSGTTSSGTTTAASTTSSASSSSISSSGADGNTASLNGASPSGTTTQYSGVDHGSLTTPAAEQELRGVSDDEEAGATSTRVAPPEVDEEAVAWSNVNIQPEHVQQGRDAKAFFEEHVVKNNDPGKYYPKVFLDSGTKRTDYHFPPAFHRLFGRLPRPEGFNPNAQEDEETITLQTDDYRAYIRKPDGSNRWRGSSNQTTSHYTTRFDLDQAIHDATWGRPVFNAGRPHQPGADGVFAEEFEPHLRFLILESPEVFTLVKCDVQNNWVCGVQICEADDREDRRRRIAAEDPRNRGDRDGATGRTAGATNGGRRMDHTARDDEYRRVQGG
ncbi:unnamed protein product [Amoebophrya sp. A120]|nr:unnamed protein product [Amoebophrya sp. A120]|eukprot:GSA120T00019715001.1